MSITFNIERNRQHIEDAKQFFRKKDYLEGVYRLASVMGAATVSDMPEAWDLGKIAYDWTVRCSDYVKNSPDVNERVRSLMETARKEADYRYSHLLAKEKGIT